MNSYANNPYSKSVSSWERHTGKDMYNRKTYCPYCGNEGRDEITAYDHMWRTLRCRECKKTYKVK